MLIMLNTLYHYHQVLSHPIPMAQPEGEVGDKSIVTVVMLYHASDWSTESSPKKQVSKTVFKTSTLILSPTA